MKKTLICISLTMLFMIVGCSDTKNDNNSNLDNQEIEIDYTNASDFEKALNTGEDVRDKVVRFEVTEYKEDSALGINCWTGEHLNFISKDTLDVKSGDYVIGRVIDEPSKVLFGSWKIPYEVLSIKYSTIDEEETENITITFNSKYHIGKDYEEVEEKFNKLGFSNIKVNSVNTSDLNKKDNTLCSVLIDGKEFDKGDIFNKKSEVEITYWKYEKPISEYELAFIRKTKFYDLYYMFDTDNNKVIYFGTDDTYISRGTYDGIFESGITINWDHGEFKEKFIFKDNANHGTLTDGNGYDWEYETCALKEAQQILDSLQ